LLTLLFNNNLKSNNLVFMSNSRSEVNKFLENLSSQMGSYEAVLAAMSQVRDEIFNISDIAELARYLDDANASIEGLNKVATQIHGLDPKLLREDSDRTSALNSLRIMVAKERMGRMLGETNCEPGDTRQREQKQKLISGR
jgi:hypothetical protein